MINILQHTPDYRCLIHDKTDNVGAGWSRKRFNVGERERERGTMSIVYSNYPAAPAVG